MFLASKIACSGIVLLLMSPWISGPHPTLLDAGVTVNSEVPGAAQPTDVNKVQQTLQEQGYYRGKLDGVLGLRTRASIRGFQKGENLPVTGQLDVRTARKLGVSPEGPVATSDERTQDKPSAGVKWANGSRRSGRTVRRPAKKFARTVPPALDSMEPVESTR